MQNLRRVEDRKSTALLLSFQHDISYIVKYQYDLFSQHVLNTHEILLVFKIRAYERTNLILSTFILNSKAIYNILQKNS